MSTVLIIIGGIIFLFGLVQWARSGALLLDIYELMRSSSSPATDDGTQKENISKSIKRMEGSMDTLMRSSIRVLGAVAICVWLFVAASFVMDIFGFDWMDRLTSVSSNRIAGNPAVRSTGGARSTPARSDVRNDRLREMGSVFRR